MKTQQFLNWLLMLTVLILGIIGCSEDNESATAPNTKGSIFGKVIDKTSLQPIKDAIVSITETGEDKTTGNDGSYRFENLEPNKNYTLSCSKINYNTATETITLGSSENKEKNILLEKQPGTLSISFNSYTVKAAGESFSISVTSNTNWQVASNTSWISLSSNEGTNNANITITCSANDSYETRTAPVIFSAGILTQTLSVTQNGKGQLTISASSLSFGNVTVGTSSNPQTFTLNATNLITDVTITSSNSFEISTSKNFVSKNRNTLTIPHSNGVIPNTVVYVRFKPVSVQTYTSNISFSGAGLTTQFVAVSGSGVAVPVPTITVPTTPLDFGSQTINTTSGSKVLAVSGSNLTNGITISAPAGFEISLSKGTKGKNSINLPQNNGSVASTNIYIYFKPTQTTAYTGNISLTSTGATTQYVQVHGIGEEVPVPTITVPTTPINFGSQTINTTSNSKVITVSGSNLTTGITITTPAGFEVALSKSSKGKNSITLPHIGGSVAGTDVYIYFKPTQAIAYSGNISLTSNGSTPQNIQVSGSGVEIPVPTITVPTAPLNFGNQTVNTTSNSKVLAVSGKNLSEGITITAPTGFEVALSKGGKGRNSITLPQAGGSVFSTNVYIYFKPTMVTAYSGELSLTSNGATTQKIPVSGSGVSAPVPTITVPTVPLDFGAQTINTTSGSKVIAVSGSNLSEGITISAPAGFEVSLTKGIKGRNSITLPQNSGSVANTNVYIYFKPTQIIAYSGDVSLNSSGATTQKVPISGSGVEGAIPTITVTPGTLDFGNITITDTSSTQHFVVSAANLTNNITIASPQRYQISKTENSGFTTSLTLVHDQGTVNPTNIYVRFMPITVQNYNSNITCQSQDCNSQNVTVNGAGVQIPWETIKTWSEFLVGIEMITPQKGFICGNGGVLYKTLNGGTTWQGVNTPVSCNLEQIVFTDSLTGYIFGTSNTYIKTTDGGSTWVSSTMPIERVAGVVFFDNNVGFISFSGNPYKTYKTVNGGNSWEVVSQFDNIGIASFTKTNASTAFATQINTTATGSKIFRTVNTGNSWTTSFTTTEPYLYTSTSYSSTVYVFSYNGVMYKTTDNGNNWTNATFSNLYGTKESFVTSMNHTFAVGSGNNRFKKTMDGGTTWNRVLTGYTGAVLDLYFFDENNGFALYLKSTGGVALLKTTNGGVNKFSKKK